MKLQARYLGDSKHATVAQILQLFFFYWPRSGAYLVNVQKVRVNATLTYFAQNPVVWNQNNLHLSPFPFSGWTPSVDTVLLQCKARVFVVQSDGAHGPRYPYLGVNGVDAIDPTRKTISKSVVILDARKNITNKGLGQGVVLGSFCP